MKQGLCLTFIGMLFLLVGCPPADINPSGEAKIEYFQSKDGRTSIVRGESLTLEWKAVKTTTCLIQFTPDGGEASELQKVACEEEELYTPEKTTNYRISALKKDGRTYVTEDLLITVTSAEPDTRLPQVTITNPADGASDVSLNSSIAVSFSETMNESATQDAFSANPAIDCDFAWDSDADALECKPDAELSAETTYTVTLSTGATDEAGNAMANAFSFKFTTGSQKDTTLPEVKTINPDNGATNIPESTNIQVGFSEPMNKADTEAAFGASPAISCDFSWNSDADQLTCDPSTDLLSEQTYTITVSTGAKDLAGNSLEKAVNRSFTTAKDGTEQFKLEVKVEGSGKVTSSPDGINCPSDCNGTYVSGTSVSLTATSASGSQFAGWGGDCSGNACQLTLDANKTVTATFNTKSTLSQFGNSDFDSAFSVDTDGDDLYWVGEKNGVFVDGVLVATDIYVRKANRDGEVAWVEEIRTSERDFVRGVAADNGAVYVAGNTWGSLEGTNSGGSDVFIRKYDSGGNIKWTKQFGTVGGDGAQSISVSGDSIYVAATIGNSSKDVYIVKYDTSGVFQWGRFVITAQDDFAESVSANAAAVYVTGSTKGSLPDTDGTIGGQDAFIVQYSSAGNLIWTKQFGTDKNDIASSVTVNGDDVYVAGQTFGSLPGTDGNKGGRDAFVQKYNGAGELKWTEQFGTSQNDSASSVSANGVAAYVAGGSSGDLDKKQAGSGDAFIRKYSSAGNLMWGEQLGTGAFEAARAIKVGSGTVYAVGETYGSLVQENAGVSDAFLYIREDE